MPVTILNESGRRIPKSALTRAARAALNLEGAGRAVVSILLIDDDTIRRLNRQYRRFDKLTDVLSFLQRDPAGPPTIPGMVEPLGDIVISVETAACQAAQQGHSLPDELNLLVIHGILHLLGHDDETESGAARMREKERLALETIGADSAGLVARSLGS